ncbi:MAG: hypothetical protein M1839_004530 [Geoglossum umbratile]|nr:MAG: hypothetical protein M1839_004530 [Geoglossum umbratile]
MAAASSTRASVRVPGTADEAYFFAGERYVKVKLVPGTNNDTAIFGPANISDEWPSLVKAGFKTVDAAFPSPEGEGMAYFFSGTQYVKIKVVPGTQEDTVVFGPASIADEWPSLSKSGFNTIDATLPIPEPGKRLSARIAGHNRKVGSTYFFSKTRYTKIRITPGTRDDTITYGPANISDEWPSLAKAGFETVDATLPSPEGIGIAYFFCGTQYAKIKVFEGTDTLIFGPASIADYWPSLAGIFW